MVVSPSFFVAALYKFVPLPHYQALRVHLFEKGTSLGIRGTLLLAHEGINGTIAGRRDAMDAFLAYLRTFPGLEDVPHKESFAHKMPFARFKVKLKKEIVTMGIPSVSPIHQVGTYVKPEEWNALIQDPTVLVIDTRNDYEVRIGTFKNAINPNIKTFRDFPEYVRQHYDPKRHKKIAMMCTGGIRCEKASAFMLAEGFEQVYHLEGGILKYLENVPAQESLWEGECFVFDQRVSVKHGLEEGTYHMCYGCREPISDQDMVSPYYVAGISCPHCYDKGDERHKKRVSDRHHQLQLAKRRQQQTTPFTA